MLLPCSPDGLVVETVYFRAEPYRLEGELAYPEDRFPAGAAILAGPHPLLGGNMHNNVIQSLGDGLAERGLASLRFNYRGVGQSEGPPLDVAHHLAQFWETSHVPDELDLRFDVQAAVAFLRSVVGDVQRLALIGYSFGCTLLPFAREPSQSSLFVLIAPTLGKHDYQAFETLTDPVLVIASEDDFAIDSGRLQVWFDSLPGPRKLVRGQLDNHFFRRHEGWLLETVCDFLQEHGRGVP
jgi:alpha/beta superfamily hydrolase